MSQKLEQGFNSDAVGSFFQNQFKDDRHQGVGGLVLLGVINGRWCVPLRWNHAEKGA